MMFTPRTAERFEVSDDDNTVTDTVYENYFSVSVLATAWSWSSRNNQLCAASSVRLLVTTLFSSFARFDTVKRKQRLNLLSKEVVEEIERNQVTTNHETTHFSSSPLLACLLVFLRN